MNNLPVRRLYAILGILALVVTASPVSRAHADDASVAVIPPRFELFGGPGDTVVEKLRVRNDATVSQKYTVDVEDFKAKDDEGGVDLIDPTSTAVTSYQLAKWITVEPHEFSVDAGAERVLDITVKIPKTAEPGGHFASVLVRRAGTASAGGAAVDTRVGSLILLRVSGSVTESASVDYFKAENSFAQYGPVTLDLRTVNNGNVHVAPRGTIVITNTFGQKVAEIPLSSANVLPGSARIARTLWDQKNLVGRYTATLVAQYGQNNGPDGKPETLSASTTFTIFPLYLLWILIAVIVILFLLVTRRRQLKKFLNKLTSD